MSSVLSQLYADGLMEARAVEQTSVFAAAELFARVEGTLPAPESSHAIRAAIDEALKCKETGEEKTILFGLTGTGYFDMTAYQKFNDGLMTDYIPTDEELEASFQQLAPNLNNHEGKTRTRRREAAAGSFAGKESSPYGKENTGKVQGRRGPL